MLITKDIIRVVPHMGRSGVTRCRDPLLRKVVYQGLTTSRSETSNLSAYSSEHLGLAQSPADRQVRGVQGRISM
jgi:hypothetical protein